MHNLENRKTFLHVSLETHTPFAIQESPGAVSGCICDTRHLHGKKNEPLVISPENYISCSTALVEQNKQSRIERGNSFRYVLHSILYINIMNRLEVVTDFILAYLLIFAIAFCRGKLIFKAWSSTIYSVMFSFVFLSH